MKLFGLFILAAVATFLSANRYVCDIKNECTVSPVQHAQATTRVQPLVNKESVRIIENRIHFLPGAKKFLSSKNVQQYLVGVANKWKQEPNKTITVFGHTDNRGSRKANYKLGLYRSKVIKKALIHYGVSANKIKVKSFGESKPMSSNRTKKGRFYNRRVEIEFN